MLLITKKYFYLLIIFIPFYLSAQNVIWIDGVSHIIQTAEFNGSNLSNIDTSVGTAFGISADIFNGKLFWVDNSTRSIMSSDLNGSNVKTVASISGVKVTIPRGIALNAQAKKVYWTDNGIRALLSSNYDGSAVTILDTGLDCPGFVAFDSLNQKIYWADNGLGAKKIQCCNTDGSNVQDVVTGLSQVWGIAVDNVTATIYWIDSGIEKIQKSSFNESLPVSKIDVITNLSGSQRGLAIDEKTNYMYWSSTNGEILKAKLDGTNEAVVDSGINYPQGITLIDSLLIISGVRNVSSVPLRFELFQNYPNPFNPSTVIKYQLAVLSYVSLKIYDVLGREVATLVNEEQKAGNYSVEYGVSSKELASGVYFYRLHAVSLSGKKGSFSETKKFILLK